MNKSDPSYQIALRDLQYEFGEETAAHIAKWLEDEGNTDIVLALTDALVPRSELEDLKDELETTEYNLQKELDNIQVGVYDLQKELEEAQTEIDELNDEIYDLQKELEEALNEKE